MTTAPHRHSNFGTKCAQCRNELIAPEWSEYRNERQVHHICTVGNATAISRPSFEMSEDIKTRDDISPSPLLAYCSSGVVARNHSYSGCSLSLRRLRLRQLLVELHYVQPQSP